MADIKRKVPNLRFKGFTDDWEQRKLRDISTRVLRKNKDLQSTLPLTISAQDGLVDQTTFFHKQVASKQLSNYILLFKGEFAYNKSYSEGYPFGAIKRLNKYSKGVLSTLYIVFKPKNVNSDFLEHYYDTSKWYREIYRNAAEGARNHGLLNISAKDFFGTMLYMPQKNEQALIANVLDHLDSLIALQQRKLDLLKQLKKGMLQKMFADKGSKRPILRFSGFKGDLVNKRLEEISKIRGGFSFKSNSFKKQGIPIIRISNIKNDGSVVGPFVFYTPLDEDAAFTLEGESIIIAMSGATTGKIASINSKQKYYQNQRVGFFEKTSCVNYDYLKYLLDTEKLRENLRKVLIAGAQPNISGKDIDKFEFVITTDQHEQKEIAKLFGSLEDDILHQKSKVSKMKSLKKFFLQKMFI